MKDIELDLELLHGKIDRIIELLEQMVEVDPYRNVYTIDFESGDLPFMDRTVLDNYEDN